MFGRAFLWGCFEGFGERIVREFINSYKEREGFVWLGLSEVGTWKGTPNVRAMVRKHGGTRLRLFFFFVCLFLFLINFPWLGFSFGLWAIAIYDCALSMGLHWKVFVAF